MNTTINNASSESTITTLCTKRIKALTAYVQPQTEIDIGGTPYTLAEVIAIYQACIDDRADVTTKRAVYEHAVAKRRDTDKTCRAFDKGLKAWVTTRFPAGSPAAKELGATSKVGAKSLETRTLAAMKAKATREARGTKSQKEKRTIKGVLPATVVLSTAPAAPATTPSSPASPPVTNGAAHS